MAYTAHEMQSDEAGGAEAAVHVRFPLVGKGMWSHVPDADWNDWRWQLRHRITSLSGQLAALERTWRDQEQKKFAEEFEQQILVLARFLEMIDRHIPYLLRKAELIEEYLQQR